MANSRSLTGKSNRHRASAQMRAPTRFETLATLNIQPFSRAAFLAWRPKICAFVLLVLIAAGLYEFFADGSFFVEQVDAQGLNILTQKEVERASGGLGYNIFFLEPSQVERALAKMPEIKSAHVMLGVPNLMLVQVQERVPEIVWLKGDEAYWVDGDGIALRARSPRVDLPSLRDLEPSGLQAGKRVTPAAFNTLKTLRNAWQQSPKTYEWSPLNGLSGVDEHGWKIIFGDANDMDLKVLKLQALIPRLVAQGARIKFIDVGKGELFYQ